LKKSRQKVAKNLVDKKFVVSLQCILNSILMATIYLSLSTKVDITKRQEILIRFSHGRINQRGKTNIFIPSDYTDENGKRKTIWDNDAQQIIIPNFRLMNDEKKELKQSLTDRSEKLSLLLSSIHTAFNEIRDKNSIPSGWLKDCIDMYYLRGKYAPAETEQTQSFFDVFDEFLMKHPISDVRKKNFRVVIRALRRYEMFYRKRKQNFTLSLDTVSADTLQNFSDYLKNEHEYYNTYPELYKAFPEYHEQKPRGQNTVNDVMTKLRTFFIWCIKNKKTGNNPFDFFKIDECVYGTPFYISIDERNLLYNTDFSKRPAIETQRDIFVFQCLVGCRIGDLYKFTKANVINGAIEYIARKTKDREPITVRVPLNSIAQKILSKYSGYEGDTLLPFISQQKYNNAIKTAFAIAGITRPVIVCDPLTRENIIRPMNEVASSHLARRCFVGNMYKKVKDQNLVSALSGHKANSKAFARYREIDEDMRKELVSMIE
jgi:site-specific recombinase XerD